MDQKNTQKSFSRMVIIGIVVVVGALIIIYAYSVKTKNLQQNDIVLPVANTKTQIQDQVIKNETLSSEQVKNITKQDASIGVGKYIAYSSDKIAMAETGDVVLFFHASWCPSCRRLNTDIEKNMNTIPAGVTILKTDYDTEIELKKKYGVTTQHTLVQVDKDGNLIKKWSGGSNLVNLLSQIQ